MKFWWNGFSLRQQFFRKTCFWLDLNKWNSLFVTILVLGGNYGRFEIKQSKVIRREFWLNNYSIFFIRKHTSVKEDKNEKRNDSNNEKPTSPEDGFYRDNLWIAYFFIFSAFHELWPQFILFLPIILFAILPELISL